jgi:hypothetical protein
MPTAYAHENRGATHADFLTALLGKFRERHGAKDAKKYYSNFDVAVLVELV